MKTKPCCLPSDKFKANKKKITFVIATTKIVTYSLLIDFSGTKDDKSEEFNIFCMAGCPFTLAKPSQPAGGHRTGILSLMPVPALE
jgi:hypothetical protein